MKKYIIGIITVFIVLIVLLPLLLYIIRFGSLTLSNNFQDWESFSNYWTVFLSLAATAVTAIVAYYAYIISKQTLQFTQIAETPRITFEMVSLGSRSVYIIKNAGKVPAVNCFLFIRSTGSKNLWDETVNCYTIKPDEVKIISWIDYLNLAEMHYQSFSGEVFTTTVDNQIVSFIKKQMPNHVNIKNYSDASKRSIEDEVIKLLNGSSENKDDMKMLSDFILNKAKDCNAAYQKNENIYNGHPDFFECINELIISIQVLDSMIEEINTSYIIDRRKYLIKIFWIQLDVGIRNYIKKWRNGTFKDTPDITFGKHIDTIHEQFSDLYSIY